MGGWGRRPQGAKRRAVRGGRGRLGKQEPSYQLLDQWLAKRPSPELLATWKDYMRAISATMGGEAKQALKSELLGRARRVAEASEASWASAATCRLPSKLCWTI